MPVYGIDRERRMGIPQEAKIFYDLISSHDALVISLAEYNHNYTTAFKNLIDWASRVNKQLWQQKPLFLLSTSPGARGAGHVMQHSLEHMPYMGANIVAHFSLPFFRQHFSQEAGITDATLNIAFRQQLATFEEALHGERVQA